ncbi:hypothetical protein MBLNU457_6449t1 [Dothideomycetes sp. NU457]
MITQAQKTSTDEGYKHLSFKVAAAEDDLGLEAGSVDVVTSAQAAHWFDYPRLFPQLGRVVRKGGTLAFWGYKDHVFVDYPKASEILADYSYANDKHKLGPYWPKGREILQDKLRAVKPPKSDWEDIQRVEYEPGTQGRQSGQGTFFFSRRLTVAECMGYIRTWSSYHEWANIYKDSVARVQGGKGDVVDQMFDEMAEHHPDLADWDKEIEIEWGSGLILARRK